MNLHPEQLRRWLSDAERLGPEPVSGFVGISTDTRSLRRGELYVALRGERFDGHDFIAAALAAGAAGLIVEKSPVQTSPVPTWVVADTLTALGRLAAGWRSTFAGRVVAVVGSNGKTTVKEMLASVTRAAYGADAVHATPGNFNNAIGVPLSLFGLREKHRVAVLELGTNHPGEIAVLADIARPDVVVITNAQREHQEFLDGVEGSARENGAALEALGADGVAVYPGDDPCAGIWHGQAGARRRVCFGLGEEGVSGLAARAAPDSRPGTFDADLLGHRTTIRLRIAGRHNVRNALAAAAGALALGLSQDVIAEGLAAFEPVRGRLRRMAARDGALVIDDTYNANPDSVRAAIDVLADEPPPRLLILGAMAEVGTNGPQFHEEVGRYARERSIERLVALGDACAPTVRAFGTGATLAADIDELLADVLPYAGKVSTVLVKGSRGMRMERVLSALCDDASAAEAH